MPDKESHTKKIIFYCVIFILFLIAGFLIANRFLLNDVAPFTSEYDGNNYSVRINSTPQEKQTAANYLSVLNNNIDKLVDYAYKNKIPDPNTSNRLYYRWNKCELKETNSDEKSAAYTLNKSAEIRICIRDEDGNFEDPNTSMFVLLHELAHVMSISYGHETEFKENFVHITNLASNLGLYKPQDFRTKPKTYCGVNINTTPCDENTCEFNILRYR